MSKVSCDIIKDLLPSYMEEICSEDTKEFVNCHLKECEACRFLIKRMQNTELVSERTEQKIVDSAKKVKNHIRKLIGFGILLGLTGLSMMIVLEQCKTVPPFFYLVTMPVFLVALYSILSDYSINRKWGKWNSGLGIAEVVLIGYSILLEFLCVWWAQNETYPFGLEANRMGLFFSYQYWISTGIQIGLFAASMWIHIKKRISCRGGMNGGILGICINLMFLSLLKRMDTLAGLIQIRNQTLGFILAEWILVVGILEMISWIRKKR